MRLVPASLTGRLVATVVALVAVAGVLVAVATTLAMRSYLTGQLDSQVLEAAGRGVRPFDGDRDRDVPPPDFDDGRTDVRGQGAGTLTALFGTAGRDGQVITESSDLRRLSTRSLDLLADVPTDGRVHSVRLPAFGDYHVTAVDRGGVTVVVGLPTHDIEDALGSLVGWEVLLTLVGVTAAGAVGLLVVRRQLRPLREVAATAHGVADLPLDTGEIGTTVRVPEEFTDPRTEVGQVGAALNTLLAHVESALDARHASEQQVRQFVADASHELRTPLTTIQGYAELARRSGSGTDDGADPTVLRTAMTKVEAEAQRMTGLVEDLLLLARLDAGRPLERAEVDLTRLALEGVADARVVAPDHRWLLDLPDEPVSTYGDEQRLHQILTNLIGNARRHTPEGTTVTVGLRRRGDAAVITVHDDGPGLPAGLVSTAFERFARGDSARTRESGGAGLGLSLVEAITQAHGGTATVESRPGDTTFTITL